MAGTVVGGEVAFTGPQAGSTADDLIEGGMRELMMGTDPATIALNPGNHAYGYSSQGPDPETQFQQDNQPSLEQLEEMEQLRQNTPNQPQQNWQQLYGQSENEKGELRRQLQAAQEAQAQLALQQQMVQAQMQLTMAQNQPQPRPQQQHYQPQGPLFPGKTREDVITLGEIEDRLAPAIQGLIYNAAESANERYSALEAQFVNSRKAQAGITPMAEFQILAEQPWINSLNGAAKVDAMVSVLALKKAQQPVQPAQPQPQPQAPMTAAPRRLLYVEPGRPTAQEPRPIDRQAAMQQEWMATMSRPLHGGQRETAQKLILMKYGANQVSGYRDTNIITR